MRIIPPSPHKSRSHAKHGSTFSEAWGHGKIREAVCARVEIIADTRRHRIAQQIGCLTLYIEKHAVWHFCRLCGSRKLIGVAWLSKHMKDGEEG
jgi:hypothetical protein